MTSDQQPTPLAVKLKERIRREGPLPVLEYMRACLSDPDHGYYRGQPAIGASGDFTTAPEISQTFGELIGIWAAVAWRAMDAPPQVDLIELGPGRGTMMSDALRAARVVPGFLEAIRLHLVESNPFLRETQRQTLAAALQRVPVSWHDELASAIAGSRPTIILANEFLDALPVRQLVFTAGAWRERCVGLDSRECFALVPGAPAHPQRLPASRAPQEGDVLETHPDFAQIADVLRQWSTQPLAALFIDYGHAETEFGETLQAVSRHRYASIFEKPGETDLTAHVDFAELRDLCVERALAVDGPITQAEFLFGMGLAERAGKLMSAARPSEAGLIEASVQRIADPFGMGGRFKVLCVRSGLPVLPPFPSAG